VPTPANNLKKDSSPEEIQQAVSDSIAQLVKEGRPQDQAIAIAFSQAEDATGRKLSRPRGQSTNLGRADRAQQMANQMRRDGSLYA
jgi:hypothetical protein